MKNIKITGVKKAVGDYKRANAGGCYDPRYGYMMLNRETGEVWVDEFYCYGHGDIRIYHDTAIVNIGRKILSLNESGAVMMITMKIVKETAEKLCRAYRE